MNARLVIPDGVSCEAVHSRLGELMIGLHGDVDVALRLLEQETGTRLIHASDCSCPDVDHHD